MRINEILRKENLGKVYQIVGYIQKSEYLVKEYNGHVYLESRENFKKIEENFFLDAILGMSFEEVFSWEDVPVDEIERRIKELKELIELRKGKPNTNLSTREIIDSYKNKNDEENETVDRLIEKQIKKRMKESDLIFKYFGRF